MDTSNILFICSGAFDGLSKVIQHRLGKNSIGFSGDVKSKKESSVGEVIRHCEPQDLLKFGLIPELVGRVPLIVTLQSLDNDALKRILTEPKNAICKQYQKLFEMDNIQLEFTEDAIDAIAQKAIDRDTGARGLRAILESVMTDIMYETASDEAVEKCIINGDTVQGTTGPVLERTKAS